MSRFRSAVRAATEFWTEPVRAERLAAFRIAVALVGFGVYLESIVPRLALYWNEDGLFGSERAQSFVEGTWRWSLLDAGLQPAVLVAVALAGLTALLVGWRARLATLVVWACTVSLFHRSRWVLNGGDDVFIQSLFYLFFAQAAAVWSLDAWRRPATESVVRVPAWPLRMVQLQLVVIYFVTGLSKTGGEPYDWWGGAAIYWSLQDVSLVRVPYAMLPIPYWITAIGTWSTLAFEIGFPLWVLLRRVRPWVLAFGVSLHLGIWALMEISWFSPAMLALYVVFWRPRESGVVSSASAVDGDSESSNNTR